MRRKLPIWSTINAAIDSARRGLASNWEYVAAAMLIHGFWLYVAPLVDAQVLAYGEELRSSPKSLHEPLALLPPNSILASIFISLVLTGAALGLSVFSVWHAVGMAPSSLKVTVRFVAWTIALVLIYAALSFGITFSFNFGRTMLYVRLAGSGYIELRTLEYILFGLAPLLLPFTWFIHYWLLARFCLLLPALARNERASPMRAWRRSRRNGLRLIILGFVIPALPLLAYKLVTNMTVGSDGQVEAIKIVLSLFQILIAATILDVCYRTLCSDSERTSP